MKQNREPSVVTYFRNEKKLLILTSITGIIYNVGMTAGPWFEGQLAQYLFDILKGVRHGRDIVVLSLIYVLVIAIVQGARALKRLYVRKFANNVTRSMKESIYHHLVHEPYAEASRENTGAVMTRAIADAEACAEGMRKFTTEIFDTGVVMIAYLVMLFLLDWRLTLIVILFPPIAYAASAALKGRVTKSSAQSKAAMSRLNSAAVDCVGNALTYRIYGEEQNRGAAYEEVLSDYEHKNVAAGIWQNSPQPVYLVISMIGVIPILLLGGRNVLGAGWVAWTIASCSSFLSCFTKLATKSSHAAKLFNAVQKARVSWKRIRPYLSTEEADTETAPAAPADLVMEHVGFTYPDAGSAGNSSDVKSDDMASGGRDVPAGAENHADPGPGAEPAGGKIPGAAAAFRLRDLNFSAHPGEIVGITGRVASGKSTFGRLFLNEYPHEGRILYGGKEISEENRTIFAYEGHDPELFTGTVRENVAFGYGDEERLRQVLAMAQIDGEVTPDTQVGREGSELSGGQQQRIALARALYSKAPVLILDDPFSAVDLDTEQKIFQALRENEKDRIILVISHRMELFPEMDQVLFLENETLQSGTHQEMMHNPAYASLYALQNTRQEDGTAEVQQGGDHR